MPRRLLDIPWTVCPCCAFCCRGRWRSTIYPPCAMCPSATKNTLSDSSPVVSNGGPLHLRLPHSDTCICSHFCTQVDDDPELSMIIGTMSLRVAVQRSSFVNLVSVVFLLALVRLRCSALASRALNSLSISLSMSSLLSQ
jgi:hypothetical protein